MALGLSPKDLEKHEDHLLGFCFQRLMKESEHFASSVYGSAGEDGFHLFKLRYRAITMSKLSIIVLMSPSLIEEDPKNEWTIATCVNRLTALVDRCGHPLRSLHEFERIAEGIR